MPYHVETGTGSTPDTTDFEYTASGQRVVQRDQTPFSGSTKTFIGDIYEQTVASFVPTQHRYKILVGSRQVAEVVRGGPQELVYYLHDDHLGSTTLITRQDGNIAETRSYDPFGGMTASGAVTGVLSSYT